MSVCDAREAAFGGLVLGMASGIRMVASGRVAGNSGAVKSCIVGETTDYSNVSALPVRDFASPMNTTGTLRSDVDMPFACRSSILPEC